MSNYENNKLIAKNSLLLYVRMLLLMGVTLYTSRVILQVLGIEDFGIYNVVGGIVTMFSFINGGMVSATQRYLTFEIGRHNKSNLSRVFCSAIQIHALISFIILVLAETIGLWFLHNKMQIPADRLTAAVLVFQCSVLACIVTIMSIPYNAAIIAHEKMGAFAYISIIEAILRLLIVFLLLLSPYDKLIIFSVLTLLVQISIRLIYSQYCKKHFAETKYIHSFDNHLLKEMASFAGWSFWGSLSSVLYTQGVNLMLNIFFGPIVNAARGIAVQVQSAVQQFVGNFQMALNPQITKNYAIGDIEQMHNLIFRSARFSFYLLFFLTLPVLLETNFLLTLWLKTVPENTIIFSQLMICISMIYSIANPCAIANQATGKIKEYQMAVGGILLTILPISFLILKLGAPPYTVFIVNLCIEAIAQFARMYMLRKEIKLPLRKYFKNIYIPIAITVIVAIIFPFWIHSQFTESWLRFVLVFIASVISITLSVFLFGLTTNERIFIGKKLLLVFKIKK